VLTTNAFGNPHTGSPTSDRTAEIVDRARLEVLNLLNANPRDYTVVFTQNASAAAKLVGEAVSGYPDIHYTYLKDAHTSLLGIRQLAATYAEFEDDIRNADLSMSKTRPVLVSWLGQSNFSGQRYPSAEWTRYLRSTHPRVFTLIDASALSTTAPPNLTEIQPDFVCMSFYKIFGHPDLGALIVRKEAGNRFFARRRYFGGGTIETVAPSKLYVGRMKDLHTQLEDGTVPFHSIIALVVAMAQFKFIFGSMSAISAHAAAVGQYAYDRLNAMQYPNGRKVVCIYSHSKYLDTNKQGPNMAFNLLDDQGEWIGYTDLQDISAEQGISLRTGGLCNAGCTVKFSGMTDDDLILNHKHGHICGDGTDVVAGKVTGVVRISFGANSSKEEVDHLCQVIEDFYIKADAHKRIASKRTPEQLRIAKYGLEGGQPAPRARRNPPVHIRSLSMQPNSVPAPTPPGKNYTHQRSGSRLKAYFTRFRRPTSMVAS
jgi:molybdenum cofactor sulfurtransferase